MSDTGINLTGTTTGTGPVDASSGSSLMSGVYKGTAGIGQFKASLGMIIAIVLGIILVLCGTYMVFYNDDDKYLPINGRILKTACVKKKSYDSNGRQSTSYKCNITVGYKVDGKSYSKALFVRSSEDYLVNEPIRLWVEKDNHESVQQAGMQSSTTGSMMIGGAIILLGVAYLNYYLTYRYEVFASAQGIGTIVDIIR
jgi:hypothetical protein